MSKLHNPVYIGPGIWVNMHTNAAWADTVERKKCVIEQFKHSQQNFPCNECKIHFGEYISTHPLEATLNGGKEALFAWTVAFHNAVNYRLKKPHFSYEDAKKIYYENSELCMKNCNEEVSVKTPPKIIPKDLPGYIF